MADDKPLTQSPWGARLVILVPYLWLAVFFLIPFLLVLRISLSESAIAQPPYVPVLDLSQGWQGVKDFFGALSFDRYVQLTEDSIYYTSYFTSLWIAFVSTLILLAIGYPIAYGMARAPKQYQPILLMLVILPFWTSFLIRVYAWIGILQTDGLLNATLQMLGVIDEPLTILQTNTAVYIGIVYSYLPFMVLPLYSTLEKMDDTLIEAAQDLGCPPWQAFWKVTFPLSLPGVFAGCLLCFIPITGEFVIPDLLGGSDTLMIGRTLWVEFFQNRDWPLASAVAIILLICLVVPIVLYQNQQARTLEKGR
jgi:putrescine transport system permease protein